MNAERPSDAGEVPPYSESAQPCDAGYYDLNGMFHRNVEANIAEALTEAANQSGMPASGDDLPIYLQDLPSTEPGTSLHKVDIEKPPAFREF